MNQITIHDYIIYALSTHPTASYWLVYVSIMMLFIATPTALLIQSMAMLLKAMILREIHEHEKAKWSRE